MHGPPPVPTYPPPAPEPVRPWSCAITLVLSILIAGAYLVVQTGVVAAYAVRKVISDGRTDIDPAEIEAISLNGTVLSVATILSVVVCIPLILLFARLRKGLSVSAYLCLFPPRWREVAIWTILYLVIFIPIGFLYTEILGRPSVHPFMIDAYKSVAVIPLLWIALIFGAPLVEEFFFRGFLFAGFRDHRIAIPVCALLWAAIHIQYDLTEIAIIFVGGIFLGIARYRTGSLWIPVYLHFVWNFIATIETAIAVSRGA